MPDNPNLIDEKDIPNWESIDVPTMIPGRAPLGAPAPPVPHDMPQFFSGSIAPVLQHDGSFVATEMGSPRIPKTALMPLGNQANPSTNAAAQSTAKIIAQQIVNAIPPASSGSATDTDIISAVNRQNFGSFDASSSTSATVPAGGGATIASIATTILTSSANEVAIVAGNGAGQPSSVTGLSPGAGWTALIGDGTFWKVIPSAGSLTVSQTLSGAAYAATQVLAVLKGNGVTPVFTQRANGSGGTALTIGPFTPTAGNSLMFIGDSQVSGNPPALVFNPASASDTAGNSWVPLGFPTATVIRAGGFFSNSEQYFLYAQNVTGTSTTITINTPDGAGNWAVYEISNVSNVSVGSYTFLTSDANKLLEFVGGANITATLPSPAFAAGWQVLASNANAGILTIVPAAGVLLNNSNNAVVVLPGQSTWLFSDGANYWSSNTTGLSTIAVAHKFFTSFNAFTGVFTQTQPAFPDVSGNIAIGQMASGTGASSATFWRGDGTWSGLGGVNSQTANYTATLADGNKLISFNSVSAVTLTLPSVAPSSTWNIHVENVGSGPLTINRNALLIDGVGSNLTLIQGQGVVIYADGTNYFTERGMSPVVGSAAVKIGSYLATANDSGKLLAFNTTSSTAFIQGVKSDYASRSSIPLAFPQDNAVGNLIVVLASNAGTNAGTMTISDTNLNTYTQLFTDVTANGNVQVAWYALNAVAGPNTVTVSWSTGAVNSAMAIAEYSGVLTAAALDQANKNTGNGNWSTPSLTTTQASELLTAFVVSASGLTSTNAPFSQRLALNSGGTFGEIADDIVTSIAAYQATGNGSGNFVAYLATFKSSTPAGITLVCKLPASPPNGTWIVFLQNFGTGTLTVNPNGLKIDGSSSNVSVAAGKGISFFTDGTNYYSFRGGS